MGEWRGVYSVLMGIPEGSDHLEDLREDGRVKLRLIFRK
jgi:hypothetical protein